MRQPALSTILAIGLLCGAGFTRVATAQDEPAQGEIVDPRDGQRYPTVEVAGTTWLARNLNFASAGSYCYEDEPENCERYGRLYRWEAALSACPAGWHLSAEYEWQAMELALGVPFGELESRRNRGTDQGAKLKVGGETGFDVQFNGWRDFENGGEYAGGHAYSALWTATESDLKRAWHRDIDIGDDMIWRSRVTKPFALAVRCVKDWLDQDLPIVEMDDGADCWLIDNHLWWSPDGSRIVLYSSCDQFDGAQIVTLDPDGSNPEVPKPNTGSNHSPEWSPDGTKIAFYSNAHAPSSEPPAGELYGAFDIYVMESDGSDLRRLTFAPGRDGGPVWSPDGSRIAFYSYRDGDGEVYVMNADGSDQRRLTDTEGFDFPMGWSRATGRILGYSNRRGNFDVFTMRPDGTDIRWLTDDPEDEEMPAFSADGRHIIYTWDDGEISRLMIRALDGSDPVVVAESDRWQFDQPTLSPDGDWIGYSVGNRGDADTERWWRTAMIARRDGREARIVRGELRD